MLFRSQRRVAGDFRICERSRFLDEIDQELVDKRESEQLQGALLSSASYSKQKEWLESSTTTASKTYEKTTDGEYDYSQGDSVTHNMWGLGEVINVHGDGPSMTLEVRFPTEKGVKLIMPKYAPITKA